jgi:hypothetical protein
MDLAQRCLLRGFAGIEPAFGPRPAQAIAAVTLANQRNATRTVEYDSTGRLGFHARRLRIQENSNWAPPQISSHGRVERVATIRIFTVYQQRLGRRRHSVDARGL